MWYIVALFSLLIVGVLDGHTSSFAALSLMFILGFVSVNSRKNATDRVNCGKVFGIVFSVYVISAFIASQSFLNGQYFYVSDSMKYIETYSGVSTWSWENTFDDLSQTYFYFADNNGLFNQSLAFWAYIANHLFDGTSEFYMTLFLTLFGVLTSLEIYKIFTLYFDFSKAAKYTCIFAALSLYHIYSVVIIRDIVIAFFYMLGLRKIIGRPQISSAFVLLLVVIVTMGVRLYSGLFFGAFIMLWLYKLIQDTKYAQYRIIIVPIIIVGVTFIAASFVSSMLLESAAEQIGDYDELYERESGTAAGLRQLPHGIRQIVILFFSQLPLDRFGRLSISNSFSNYYLSILAIIYKIFGFVVFYGLMYYCFVKGLFRKMQFNERWILIIMLIFVALTLSTHIDVRRSMEAIPFFYLFYMLFREQYNHVQWRKVNNTLIVAGIFIMLVYAVM